MRLLRVAPLAAVLALGCDSIPVEMHTATTVQHSDGTVEHKETHWHGRLDGLMAGFSKDLTGFGKS